MCHASQPVQNTVSYYSAILIKQYLIQRKWSFFYRECVHLLCNTTFLLRPFFYFMCTKSIHSKNYLKGGGYYFLYSFRLSSNKVYEAPVRKEGIVNFFKVDYLISRFFIIRIIKFLNKSCFLVQLIHWTFKFYPYRVTHNIIRTETLQVNTRIIQLICEIIFERRDRNWIYDYLHIIQHECGRRLHA